MSTELVKTILTIGSAVVLATACQSKGGDMAAREPVASESVTINEGQAGGTDISDREVAKIDETSAAGQQIDIEKATRTRGVIVPGVGAAGQRTTTITAENVGPAMRYPLVDPAANTGHPVRSPAFMTEGGIVDIRRYEQTGPRVAQAQVTETVVVAAPTPEVGAAGMRGEATPCGKLILGKSAGAVGDPCITQADFIASLNLSDAQLARLRQFGMPAESLAH